MLTAPGENEHTAGGKRELEVFWQDRIAEVLSLAGPRCHLVCEKHSGIEYALNRLAMDSTPLVKLTFLGVQNSQEIAHQLASSVEAAFGVQLIQGDAPLRYSLSVMSRELVRLGPARFAVLWSNYCPELVDELGTTLGNQVQLFSIAHTGQPQIAPPNGFLDIEPTALLVSEGEAVVAAGDSMKPSDAIALMRACRGQFGDFIQKVDSSLEMGPFWSTESDGVAVPGSSIVPPATLLEALVNRRRWIEAFELACTRLPGEVARVVRLGGHQLVDIGAFEYLWDGLSRLPDHVKRDPDVAYWLVVAASATNRVPLVRELADEVLNASEAPDLRAAVAVLHPNVTMLSEATRAIKAMETPTTLRAMAFALASAGDRKAPVVLFRRAMERAEKLRANHLVIACAIDIANQEVTLGHYKSGVDWARWALHELDRRRINEPLRRHAAAALITYGTILSSRDDDIHELRVLISAMRVDWTRIGAPTYESVVSTIGDWYFASGDFALAEEHYRGVLDGVPVSQYASAALDVVRVLIAQRRNAEARELAAAAHTLAGTSTPTEHAFAKLALGMAIASSGRDGAIPYLKAAIAGLRDTSFVVFEAQAHLWLALCYLTSGRLDLAARMLNEGADGIRGLGNTGWRFLLCDAQESAVLQALWHSTSSYVQLAFLGNQTVIVNGASLEAPLRTCEILTLLSESETGVAAERLRLMIFGDGSTAANVKATISRMRKQYPISSSPYKLIGRVTSDFGEVIRSIEKGDLYSAIGLYRGPLLAGSDSPAISELRNYIEESLKMAVLASDDVELLMRLGNVMEGELELWERARSILSPGDSRRGLVNARIRRIRRHWEE